MSFSPSRIALCSVLLLSIFQETGSFCLAQDSPYGSPNPTALAGISSEAERGRSETGETRVSVPGELESVFRRGGVPESLSTLRVLEAQQKKIGRLAEACTVSVRIGPAQGSGVIITETGYIVTAAHVAMRPGLEAVVTLSNGRQVKATTLGMNKKVDAGLIRINPGQNGQQPWPYASLGTSDDLKPGMWCIAVGHPGGYDPTRGTVLRVGRLLNVSSRVLVSDCALIGGDSGGPLFNFKGELIGVHSRIGNDVSDNLHVPINHYDRSWDRMMSGESWGHLPGFRPTLGVSGSQSTADASILDVKPGSPASAAGIKAGDTIIRFGEKSITDFQSLKDAVSDTMPGERLSVLARRDGSVIKLNVEIGRAEEE
ncbi:MAG: trypsin-like peptidase domain-containing protein [Planctomycetota bacterium]